MQALRRAGCSSRPLTLRASTTSTSTATRFTAATFSTTSSNSDHHRSSSHAVSGGKGPSGVLTGDSIIPLSNIQAQWENMTEEEQNLVHRQLEELQAKDWRNLSLDEKRAGQSRVSFPLSFFDPSEALWTRVAYWCFTTLLDSGEFKFLFLYPIAFFLFLYSHNSG
jgi:hypothetical protein